MEPSTDTIVDLLGDNTVSYKVDGGGKEEKEQEYEIEKKE